MQRRPDSEVTEFFGKSCRLHPAVEQPSPSWEEELGDKASILGWGEVARQITHPLEINHVALGDELTLSRLQANTWLNYLFQGTEWHSGSLTE